MANLHIDTITDILSRLLVKSLLRFKSVCKAWNSLINDTRFINMHLYQAINNKKFNLILSLKSVIHSNYDSHYAKAIELDHPDTLDHVAVYGSSNGLVHINFFPMSLDFELDVLWKPCTKEFRVLPKSPLDSDVLDDLMVCRCTLHGFGYSPVMDDYRVVEVYQFFNQDMQFLSSQVMIYTLGMDSWKVVDGAPYFVGRGTQLPTNENPHWPALTHPFEDFPKSIAYFDLAKEIFCEIQYPKCVGDVINVGVLGGCLCLVGGLEKTRSDVWVMKEYGVLESWTKLFTINSSTMIPSVKALTLLFSDKNGKVLLDKCGDLVLYNPRYETAQALEIQGLPTDWHKMHVYVGSLVSLKSGTYVD